MLTDDAIGAEAWQCCRHLRVVRMPSTVARIADNTFRGCQLLNSVAVPGCIEFGYKAFADCCSLQWIHANGGGVNQLERRETRKVGQREEKRTREAGTKMQCSTW